MKKNNRLKLIYLCFGMVLSLCCVQSLQANENNLQTEEGVPVGSTVYEYDENGDLIEFTVDNDRAVTLEKANQDYYEKYVGNGEVNTLETNPYKLISISEYGIETEINAYEDYNEALKAYNKQILIEPDINYAIKSQDTYWVIKYAVVRFKYIQSSDGSTILNHDYTDVENGCNGYLNPVYGIDAAFISKDDDSVVFKIGAVTGKIQASLLDLVPYCDKTTYLSYYQVSSGKLYHYIRKNDLSTSGSYTSAIMVGYPQEGMNENTVYYSYDGHYFYTDYFKMIDDYRQNSSENAVNANKPYYNYYQFLPLHSMTNYTAQQLDSYIADKYSSKPTSQNYDDLQKNQSLLYQEGSSFMQGHEVGVNPLLSLGIAINESGWGRSRIAIQKNNLFGLNAIDVNPSGSADVFLSVSDCVDVFYRQWVNWGYLDTNDWRYFGGHLGDKVSGMNVKYASDPYWGEKAASHSYYIDEFLGKNDYQKYSLGIKESSTALDIVKKAANNSDLIYSMKNKSYLVKNMPFILIDQVYSDATNWYKIYTDHPLDGNQKKIARYNNESLSWIYAQIYDFNTSYGYVTSDSIRKINDAKKEEVSFDINAYLEKASLYADNGFLYGIHHETQVESLIQRLNGIDVQIHAEIDLNGHDNDKKLVTSDMKLILSDADQKTYELLIVIIGDVNCDGKISPSDYVLVRNHINGKKISLVSAQKAADVNKKDGITPSDYVMIRNHITGKKPIQ